MSDQVAASTGWPAGNPFKHELAFYHLGSDIVGILGLWWRDRFWAAAATVPGVFGLGAAFRSHARVDMKTLSTARLRLRPMERSDLRILQGFYGDPELMRFITGRARTPWETRARLAKDLRDHREFGFGLCIAEWREDGHAIGRCGLEPVEGREGLEGEAAWMFAKPWWGMGLASEVGAALISLGLDDLGLERVFAAAHPHNLPSIRVMQKLGMRRVDQEGAEVVYEIRR